MSIMLKSTNSINTIGKWKMLFLLKGTPLGGCFLNLKTTNTISHRTATKTKKVHLCVYR